MKEKSIKLKCVVCNEAEGVDRVNGLDVVEFCCSTCIQKLLSSFNRKVDDIRKQIDDDFIGKDIPWRNPRKKVTKRK